MLSLKKEIILKKKTETKQNKKLKGLKPIRIRKNHQHQTKNQNRTKTELKRNKRRNQTETISIPSPSWQELSIFSLTLKQEPVWIFLLVIQITCCIKERQWENMCCYASVWISNETVKTTHWGIISNSWWVWTYTWKSICIRLAPREPFLNKANNRRVDL